MTAEKKGHECRAGGASCNVRVAGRRAAGRSTLTAARGRLMALGTCRHCGSTGIPTDAPICRSCAGWRPNPGLITRMGVVTTRVVALLMLLGGLALTALGVNSLDMGFL